MKLRSYENAKARRDSRRLDFDKSKVSDERGRKRPGSLNPKKGNATGSKRR